MNKNAYISIVNSAQESFTVEELARLTGLSKSVITDRCRCGILEAQKYKSSSGVWWDIDKESVLQFLERFYPRESGIIDSYIVPDISVEQ